MTDSTKKIVEPKPEGLEKAQKIIKELHDKQPSEEFLKQIEECILEDRYLLEELAKKGD